KEDRHNPAAKTWEFYYSLKPRTPKADRIPALTLNYYDPAVRKDQTDPSRAIPIRVKMRPKVIVAPERMYQLATGPDVLRTADPEVPWAWIIAGLLIVPAGCLAGYGVWRHFHPTVAAEAGRRRSRAARQALHALGQLQDEPAGEQVERVVLRYLHQ